MENIRKKRKKMKMLMRIGKKKKWSKIKRIIKNGGKRKGIKK